MYTIALMVEILTIVQEIFPGKIFPCEISTYSQFSSPDLAMKIGTV